MIGSIIFLETIGNFLLPQKVLVGSECLPSVSLVTSLQFKLARDKLQPVGLCEKLRVALEVTIEVPLWRHFSGGFFRLLFLKSLFFKLCTFLFC